MKTASWLERNAPGFRELSAQEREAISNFSLLWTVFEARALGMRASAKSIHDLISSWAADGRLAAKAFDEPLAYFRGRYFVKGEPTENFAGLHLRNNDFPELVRAVLRGENDDPVARVAATLIVIYRFRNNLFHGVKWAYGIKGQLENFQQANGALMAALDVLGPIDHSG